MSLSLLLGLVWLVAVVGSVIAAVVRAVREPMPPAKVEEPDPDDVMLDLREVYLIEDRW